MSSSGVESATNSSKTNGFTLFELLIVAIILAILAAIIVPQFAATTGSAQEAALKSQLAGIRGAIALYRQSHGAYPGAQNSISGGCSSGNPGTGAAETQQALEDQLMNYTNGSGKSCTRKTGGFKSGPYLAERSIPANPITNVNTVIIVGSAAADSGDLAMSGDGPGGGWKYDVISGKFIANDTNTDSQGVRFDSY